MKTFICIVMAVFMTNAPHIALAQTAEGMISTATVVEQMSRTESVAKINELLSREDVQAQMLKLGVTRDEISKRVATLSDAEVRQLTKQIDKATFGGEITGILIVVVLVLLVIFLARRI